MDASRSFRLRLAARIVGVLGAAALAPQIGCGGTQGGASSQGSGASSSSSSASNSSASSTAASSSSAGTGGAGTGGAGTGGSLPDAGSDASSPPTVQQCFDWAADAGDCPFDGPTIIMNLIPNNVCPTTGWEPFKIDSGPTTNASGQCCYVVELELCALGGRPYLVAGRARVSPPERGEGASGWRQGECSDVAGLTDADKAALAEAWTADALLEHASVASFSRFSLALLAAGAPSHLVELAHQAALDEIAHARLCFSLASAYAGEEIVPGPFPLGDDVRVGAGLAELAVSTVREGCVGETVAAVIAAEQLARAKDPAVRAALAKIAADEARHAELAWKTVAWAVQAGGPEVRAAAARTLMEALAGSLGASPGAEDAGAPRSAAMEAHGRLDAATATAFAAAAMADVVAPAAWTLFGPDVRPGSASVAS